MIAVSSSSRSCGSAIGLAALEAALDRADRPALDDPGAAFAAPLVASATKSGQTKAIFAPESVKK